MAPRTHISIECSEQMSHGQRIYSRDLSVEYGGIEFGRPLLLLTCGEFHGYVAAEDLLRLAAAAWELMKPIAEGRKVS